MRRILGAAFPAGVLLLMTACAGMGGPNQGASGRTAADQAEAADAAEPRVARDRQGAQPGTRPFEGRVVDLRTLDVRGTPHVLARLEAQGGQHLLVDLGRASELRAQELRLHWGERISGRGIPARVGRYPVLAATRLSAGDQQLSITPRLDQQRAREQQTMRGPARVLLRGRIVDTRRVAVRGSAQPHHLIKVRTRQGVTVADLGPHAPEALNLQQGDWVAVVGEPGRISGKPVVLAQNVAELRRLRR